MTVTQMRTTRNCDINKVEENVTRMNTTRISYSKVIEPLIICASSGFSGYKWLETKIVFKIGIVTQIRTTQNYDPSEEL